MSLRGKQDFQVVEARFILSSAAGVAGRDTEYLTKTEL